MERMVSIYDAEFDAAQMPVLGDINARHLMLGLFDFSCHHCRRLHQTLERLRMHPEAAGYATVILPASRNDNGLEIQRVMLAAWRSNRNVYAFIADQLYHGGLPALASEVYQAAADMLGSQTLREALEIHHDWIEDVLGITAAIYAENHTLTHSRGLPQLIVGAQILLGSLADDVLLDKMIEAVDPEQAAKRRAAAPRVEAVEVAGDTCEEPGDSKNSSRLDFGVTRIDLGELFVGEPHPVALPYVNEGMHSATIVKVESLEDIQVVAGMHETIPPGGGGHLTFEVIPEGGGELERLVRIFPEGNAAPLEITFVAQVRPLVSVTPEIFDFGVTPIGETPEPLTAVLRLEEAGNLGTPQCTLPGMNAFLRELEQGKIYEVIVEAEARQETGRFEGAVEIPLHIEGKTPRTVAISVILSVQADIYLRPEVLVLTTEELKRANTRRAVMVRTSHPGIAFRVVGVDIPPEWATAGVRADVRMLSADAGYMVDFSFPKNFRVSDKVKASFIVRLDQGGSEILFTVPLEVRPPMNISSLGYPMREECGKTFTGVQYVLLHPSARAAVSSLSSSGGLS